MGECIDEVWLPQCLAIGIDYQTFDLLNPRKIKPFRKVFKEKKEEELATINFTTWLQGRYFADAIGAKFDKNGKYPEKPIELKSKPKTTKDDAEAFGAWAIAFNNSHKELEEGQ